MTSPKNIIMEDVYYDLLIENLKKYLTPSDTVFAFGSRVKKTAKKYSDLDLAIITEQNLFPLREALEESALPFTVDVLEYNKIPDYFRAEIDECKVLLDFK